MKHYNPTIAEDATRIFNLKNGDMMPEDIDVIATVPIKSVQNINIKAAAAGTIYTTPTGKDFYLCRFSVASSHAAADTGTDVLVTATINGVATDIFDSCDITLIASNRHDYIHLDPPIKIDRGTNIVGTAANYTRVRFTLGGYTVETTKGN